VNGVANCAAYARACTALSRAQAYNSRMELMRILIVAVLIAIVISLGSALYHMATGTGDSKKMLRALTWRISLSVALFVLLLLAWSAGLIAPLGAER